MKLSKRFLASAVAAVMILTSATGVFAAGSRGAGPSVPTPRPATTASRSGSRSSSSSSTSVAPYKVESKIQDLDSFKALKESNPEIAELIEAVNAGTMDGAAFAEGLTALKANITDEKVLAAIDDVVAKLAGKDFVTPFFDIAWREDATQAQKDALKNSAGKFVFALNIPALTEDLTGVEVLHYSTERGLIEQVAPANLDLAKKTVSVALEDISPIAIVADVKAEG